MVKASSKSHQQRRRALPRASSNKTAKQRPSKKEKKGIHFSNDKVSQAHIQTILIEILTKWRQCEPKKKDGEPPHGSLSKLVAQYKETQHWLKDSNKPKMKWRNMSAEDKRRIDLCLPLEDKKKNSTQQQPKSTANPGRPTGTTNKAKQEQKQKFIDMKNDIALAWSNVKDLPIDQKPSLQDIIKQKQDEFGLDSSIYSVSTHCIYSRFDRQRLEVQQTGQVTPVWKIEPKIVMLIQITSECNKELTREDIISFANSYIEGTEVEQEVIKWKLTHHKGWQTFVREHGVLPQRADLGGGWFNGFINRYKDKIQYKPSSNVSYNRKEHCTYENFCQMYDSVYKLLLDGGYAEKMVQPTFYNKLGEMCEEGDEQAFGNIVDLAFIRPDLVFVADECGSNTNMSRDKMSAGNKRCSVAGASIKIPACTSDCHFTTLAWTALTGEPVFAVIIIEKGSPLTYAELNGFDIDAKWIGNDDVFQKLKSGEISFKQASLTTDDLLRNTGIGKVFPGGPVCEYKGVKIPTLVRRSDSGGITPEILVDVLRHFDKHIPRKEGDPPPACILDGHSSRLSIPFLRYIRNLDGNGDVIPNSNHKWNVFLGLPNGTAYWQVGDSSQQNGRYKNLNRKEKEYIRDRQREFLEGIKIERTHVQIILSNVWDKCYGDTIGNKKAILERGWNPLNRGVLHHSDIQKSKSSASQPLPSTNVSGDNNTLNNANVSKGKAGQILSMLQTSNRRDLAYEQSLLQQKIDTGQGRTDNKLRAMAVGRVTAGTVTAAGIWNLSNEGFCAVMEEKNKKKVDKSIRSKSKTYDADMTKYLDGMEAMKKALLYYTAMKDEVHFIIDTNEKKTIIKRLKKEKKWLLSSDYKILIQFKQLAMEKSGKIPTKLEERMLQWESVYRQRRDPSMPVKPTNYVVTLTEIGEEVDDDDDDEDGDFDIEGLARVHTDIPRTATSIEEHEAAARSLLTFKLTPACAAPTYHGAQQWSLQLEAENSAAI